jgi:hypothetical protein
MSYIAVAVVGLLCISCSGTDKKEKKKKKKKKKKKQAAAATARDATTANPLGASANDPSTGDRVTWTKSDDDIPIGLVGEIQGPAHDGRLSVEFNGRRFNLRPEELVLATTKE